MNSSQRMIINTLATFSRSVLAGGLALFSSRWILNALGQVDFGLFSLVGSLIAFISLLNGVLGGSAGRFFAFSIGKGDAKEVNQWFNTAIVIHFILSFILVGAGWPIGEYFIRYVLDIPDDRLISSLMVFRLSLMAAFFTMLGVPYISMFSAKQHISETAFWTLLQAIMNFILAFSLTYFTNDRLVDYAIGIVFITFFITALQVIRAINIFPECRIKRKHLFDKVRAIELFNYASWSLIGCLGGLLRNQGTAVMMNLFHGPIANAAYGIANQVSSQTGVLAQSMVGAMSPEITSAAGRNDRQRFLDLSFRASRFGVLLVLMIVIPFYIEMDYVLRLWLKNPPPDTAIFSKLILISFLLDRLTIGHMIAINSNRKVAAYQSSVGIILMLSFPLAYLFLKIFFAPQTALFAFIVTSSGCTIGRIYWGNRLVGLSPRRWLTDVMIRCIIVALPVYFLSLVPEMFFPPTFLRLVLTLLVSIVAIAIIGWYYGIDMSERFYIKQNIKAIYGKIVSKSMS
ncbi:hypothetical protein BIU88_00420 [Chlorobaculum limnaeum]|uniref:Polysaccharide biosynthesis protein n=1 Tax=Chlorobaculum limnaeum TaxID=274537 RepID=A0A1D8CV95_CHLLM|nr:oligosaccharide flippase family protein [Chlorobaculum limnaeum]AOS82746.1 hypothetical protein BIU88_00420 [Chlorobaculum limnaeum]